MFYYGFIWALTIFYVWFHHESEANACHNIHITHIGGMVSLHFVWLFHARFYHFWVCFVIVTVSRFYMGGMNHFIMYWFDHNWANEKLVTICTFVMVSHSCDNFMLGFIIWLLNASSQYAHCYGFSSVWILSCLVLLLDVGKLVSQYAHWYGLSLVWWVLSCMVLLFDWVKLLSQYAHWYGFSFVWILSWMVFVLNWEKLFSQYAHWYGFSLDPFMTGLCTWLRETLVTVCTLVWFIIGTCMNPFMSGFIAWRRKTLVTICTLVRFIFSVNPFMRCLGTWLRESLVTVCTLVWFLLGMNPFMRCLLTWVRESLVTVCTLVWFLVGMNPFMNDPVTQTGESLFTVCTLVSFRIVMNPFMNSLIIIRPSKTWKNRVHHVKSTIDTSYYEWWMMSVMTQASSTTL